MIPSEGDRQLANLIQPILSDLNELTMRKSSRVVKSTAKVRNSDDKGYKRMFGLATRIPV